MITTSGQELAYLPDGSYLNSVAGGAAERLVEHAMTTCFQQCTPFSRDSVGYRPEQLLIRWLDHWRGASDSEVYRLCNDTDGTAAATAVDSRAVSVADMVTVIQRILGLTAAQVAQCIGVSRPALYKHINNETPRDIEAYYRLYEFALKVEREVGAIGKLQKTVLIEGKTFVRHLCERPDEEAFLLDAARQVASNLAERSPPQSTSLSEQRLVSRSISRSG